MKSLLNQMSEMKKKYAQITFYVLMLAYPVVQFLVFYVGVNLQSFTLAFQNYVPSKAAFEWVGWDNFVKVWNDLIGGNLKIALINGVIVYIVQLIFVTPLRLIFSYYIYKRFKGHRFFKVLYFAPSILPAIIMTMIFKIYVNDAVPEYLGRLGIEIGPLMALTSPHRFFMVNLYTILITSGTSVLLTTSQMEQISPSVLESAKLDGAGAMRELFSIVLPQIRPMFNITLIAGVTAIFMSQVGLFEFYGYDVFPTDYTLGYYMYYMVSNPYFGKSRYGYVSALGLCCSFIAIVVTLLLRHWLAKTEDV